MTKAEMTHILKVLEELQDAIVNNKAMSLGAMRRFNEATLTLRLATGVVGKSAKGK